MFKGSRDERDLMKGLEGGLRKAGGRYGTQLSSAGTETDH